MIKQEEERFLNPGKEERSLLFWAWNGRLEKNELLRQMREMKEAGVGGFFIHSREGLETEYMGPEWMDCVKAVVAEAKKLDLEAWLYDEDRWPSGFAGGKVPAAGDAFRCKGLTLEVLKDKSYEELYREEIRDCADLSDTRNGIVAAYGAVIDGDDMTALRRLSMREDEILRSGETLLALRLEVSGSSDWFNGEAPPDNLNPDCVRFFIEETHEKYKAAVGEEFGKTIPGIFTDEPGLHDNHASFGETKSWIPWTYGLNACFQELSGYDFMDVAPWFYFNGASSGKTRHDYWGMISRRFGESYFKTLGDWCGENHLKLTGHFLQEYKTGLCVRVNGSVMPHYQYMQIPGIDLLCEQTGEYLTVKQCTSVARQLGREMVMTETDGCTGWNFTFEGQKWIGDWQYILGVNRRCRHLSLYTLRGCRKRDYPPSLNYQVSWWKKNRWMDEYFARFSILAKEGKAVCRILVLHPVSTVWGNLGSSPYGNPVRHSERDIPGQNIHGTNLNRLIEDLEREHLDCDLGDESLIAEYGGLKDGAFCVGKASYQVVILPEGMENLEKSTIRALEAFLNAGGRVLSVKTCPSLADGEADLEGVYDRLTGHSLWTTVSNREELLQELAPYRTVSIEAQEGQQCRDILYQLRQTKDGAVLLMVNNSRERAVDARVKLPFWGSPQEMDLFSGQSAAVSYGVDASGIDWQVHLSRTGSAAFYIRQSQVRETVIAGDLHYRLDQLNVLPLDICCYRMDGEEFSQPMEVFQAQNEIRARLGMKGISRNGQKQRYLWIDRPHAGDGHKVELLFSFNSRIRLRDVSLVMERPEEFDVTLKSELGETAVCTSPEAVRGGMSSPGQGSGTPADEGWFLDREFKSFPLPGGIGRGENSLLLSCHYRNDFELENIYLTGNFGVSEKRCIQNLPQRLPLGDWTRAGLKHYSGSVTLEFSFEKRASEAKETWLILPEWKGICAELSVNGHSVPLVWNREEGIAVGSLLTEGENHFALQIYGSPRNMMGPFHLKEEPHNTGAACFSPTPGSYAEEYLLAPFGLMGEIRLVEV